MSAALQKAVIGTLRAALDIPVYDEVPEDADLPYVVLDEMLSLNDDGLIAQRERVMLYLSVWRRGQNALGVLETMAAIKAVLHNRAPTLEQGTCASLREVRHGTDRDIDRSVRIGRLTYMARLAP